MSNWISSPLSRAYPTEIEWLWPRYLPFGKLAILDGDPGMGKSLIAMDLAARLTRGLPMPDGTGGGEPRKVILITAEDDAGDTLRPRAEAAGADLDKIIRVGLNPTFPAEINDLFFLICEHLAKLVVIDPLSSHLSPNIATGVEQSVRKALEPLAITASSGRCAVLLIRHLTKSTAVRPSYRGLGSAGITSVVRTGLYVSEHPGGEWNTLSVLKSNLVSRPPGMRYRVVSPTGAPRIEWLGPDETPVAAAMAPSRSRSEKDRAVAWLRRLLANGPRPTTEIFAAAEQAEISERTLHRAKRALGVQSSQQWQPERRINEWTWEMKPGRVAGQVAGDGASGAACFSLGTAPHSSPVDSPALDSPALDSPASESLVVDPSTVELSETGSSILESVVVNSSTVDASP